MRPPRELLERDPHGHYIPEVRTYRDLLRHWPLPLVRLKPRGVPNNQWVWAATCATADNTDIDVRHIHKRFDTQEAEQRVDRLPANTDVGVLKPWRIPVPVTVCSTLTWWALGDPTGIERVVTRVDAI
ncbi:MAG TPA: hypothetical protein VF188_11990, partial [Longimicrobiales bacterium]